MEQLTADAARPGGTGAECARVDGARAGGARAGGARAGFTVRRASLADLPALDDFFADLSVQSRYLRFFGPLRPNPVLLRMLCGEPADVDAVVAVRDGVIIGHAMAADAAPPPAPRGPDATRDRGGQDRPPAKDIGIVVADAWQGQGVGAALMRTLIAAIQARGVTTLAMDVLEGNRKVLAMISAHWPATRAGRSRDCVTVEVRLPPPRPRQLPATAGSRRAASTAGRPTVWSGRAQVSRAARA